MAKLAWLMFTLVLLNSTVKINADFQLITTLAKLIKSVEQMNSSISKINDRLEKLESTIPMKREHIVPDTEPKHGLIDNMIKTLEAEKVFIRKSVSAHEKKFQAFESQMKRHLSTIHTAIDSNKDNIEQQIKLINDTIDKNSEMLEKELILININIDEKADALEQQMVLVNATIDSNKEMVETQIQRINVTIDKHCETLEKELRLINTTLERQYRKQRCSLSHGSLQLYNGNIKLNIAEHDSTVEVKCKNGDKYELKNTETDLYIDSYDTKCLFGHLDKDLSMLKCLPRPNVTYSVRLQVSGNGHSPLSGTEDNVFVRIVGNGKTDEFELLGDFDENKYVEMNYIGTDVRPIQNVVVSKDAGYMHDNELSLAYVSIYIEDSEEYYVFTGRSLHTRLTASQSLTLNISDHPENCQRSHTYKEAFYRSPRVRRDRVGILTLLECKKRCVTSRSLKCNSVFYMPSYRERGKGHCFLNKHSPDDDRYFRDSYRSETNNGYVSYKRICKTT